MSARKRKLTWRDGADYYNAQPCAVIVTTGQARSIGWAIAQEAALLKPSARSRYGSVKQALKLASHIYNSADPERLVDYYFRRSSLGRLVLARAPKADQS